MEGAFSEKHGWLDDKYGLSWQVIPEAEQSGWLKDKYGLA
ncbi:MAG: VOC family protein [Thermoleophilia bacterium]